MSIENYRRVRLLVDTYSSEGVRSGSLGYVIEVYADNKYEVEFSNDAGETIAQLVLNDTEIIVDEPGD
jgi:Domain of unknown function (DUF4926)